MIVVVHEHCVDDEDATFSLTFNLISTSHEKLQKKRGRVRFWAKLADVNAIECYPIGSPTQQIEDSVFASYVMLGGLRKRLLVI